MSAQTPKTNETCFTEPQRATSITSHLFHPLAEEGKTRGPAEAAGQCVCVCEYKNNRYLEKEH